MIRRLLCWLRGHAEPVPAFIIIGSGKVPCGVCSRCSRVMPLS